MSEQTEYLECSELECSESECVSEYYERECDQILPEIEWKVSEP